MANNKVQKRDNRAITRSEQTIMDIMLDPANRKMTITDICKQADVSRNVYYNAVNKAAWQDEYRKRTQQLINQSIAPVVNTMIGQAIKGSYQHGRTFLEMAGLYHPEIDVSVTLDVSERQQVIASALQRRIASSESIDIDYEVIDD